MKRSIILLLLIFINFQYTFSQPNFNHGRIKATPNGHFLQFSDGKPFFWLGDTGWELFHRLKLDEIESYFKNRSKKGFNVIQAAILAEMDGLKKPNKYGDLPLYDENPERPNEHYFKFVDSVIKLAEKYNLYMGLLPTWGDKVTKAWGVGPVVFNTTNAYAYGAWLGKRYNNYKNVIWILGGDRPAMNDSNDWRPVWRAMANGILDGTHKEAFISYHPSGGFYSSSQFIHNEQWLDMNMIQSGHGGGHDVEVWKLIKRDFELFPHKPVLDDEPNYEDHPVNPWPKYDPANGYYRAYDVRKQLYRAVFSGACGATYGHHSVWQFYSEHEEKINFADRYWREALDRPGSFQAGYLRKLMLLYPILSRVPSDEIIITGQGNKADHISAFKDSSGSYAMVYLPQGKTISINTDFMPRKLIEIKWWNPRDGIFLKTTKLKRLKMMKFTAPTIGNENDWVLILRHL
ncbi:MAG: glycoside hydrolase family 140 protein [Flavisolibacter sp.]